MPPRRNKIAIAAGVLVVVAVAALWIGRALMGVHTVRAATEPVPLEGTGFPHRTFDPIVSGHVIGERVDYEGVVAEQESLRRYVARLERTGPRTDPDRFSTRESRLAYYINAYNALTLLGVVDHWPIDTIHEVRGWFEPVAGTGFFWSQRFVLDGRKINLYDLEHEILRPEFDDARIHAAINCASVSCPALAPWAYTVRQLESMLDEAARGFATADRHVRIDDDRREVVLSSIFDWFVDDFEAHASKLGAGDTVLDWIAHYAAEPKRSGVVRARDAGYDIRHAEYDWRLNGLAPGM